jgi:hypothetical protein
VPAAGEQSDIGAVSARGLPHSREARQACGGVRMKLRHRRHVLHLAHIWLIASRLMSGRWISVLLFLFCVVMGGSTASACTFPQVQDGFGNCVSLCPSGQTALPGTGTCVGAGVTCAANEPSTPPSGTIYTSCCPSGQQPAVLNTAGGPVFTGSCCPPGQAAQGNGSCLPTLTIICQAGQNPNNNLCCLPNEAMTNRLTCCPVGQAANPDGSCGPNPCSGSGFLAPATNNVCKVVCPQGQHAIPGTTSCVCPNGYGPKDGSCNLNPCGPHQRLNAQDLCQTVCGAGQVYNSSTTSCVCRSGVMTSAGICCLDYQSPYSDGSCGPPCSIEQQIDGICQTMMMPGYAASMKHNRVACEPGLVPRDAYRGDPVCVTPQARDQTNIDNLVAPSHTNPQGLCYHGYFWRRAIPSDHVCVTPETRARVQAENARAPMSHCQPGETLGDGRCVPAVQPPNCPPGEIMRDGRCVPAAQPPNCPPGETMRDGRCAPPQSSNRNIFRWRWLRRGTTGRSLRRTPEMHHPPEHRTPHGGGSNGGGHGGSHGGGRRR